MERQVQTLSFASWKGGDGGWWWLQDHVKVLYLMPLNCILKSDWDGKCCVPFILLQKVRNYTFVWWNSLFAFTINSKSFHKTFFPLLQFMTQHTQNGIFDITHQRKVCTPGTNTMLHVSYTSVLKKNRSIYVSPRMRMHSKYFRKLKTLVVSLILGILLFCISFSGEEFFTSQVVWLNDTK